MDRGYATARPPAVLTVEQTGEFIEIRPLSLLGPRPGRYRFGLQGSASGTSGVGGGNLWSSSVVWNGNSLVVTEERSSITQGGNVMHQSRHEEVWSLGSKNLLTVVITDEETGAAPTTMRFVYRRKL
jgi:hypothetical protein